MNPLNLNLNLGLVAGRLRDLIDRQAPLPTPLDPAQTPPVVPEAPEQEVQREAREERLVDREVREERFDRRAQRRKVKAKQVTRKAKAEATVKEARTNGPSPERAAAGARQASTAQAAPVRADAPLPSLPEIDAPPPGSLESILDGLSLESLEKLTHSLVKSVGRAAVLETRLESLARAAERAVDPQRFEPLLATVEQEVTSLLKDVAQARDLVPPAARELLSGDGSQLGLLDQLEQLGKKLSKALSAFDVMKTPDQIKELKILRGELKELSVLAAQGGAAGADELPSSVKEAIFSPTHATAETGHAQGGQGLDPSDPVLAKFLELYFQDQGDFGPLSQRHTQQQGAQAKATREALLPEEVQKLATQVAQDALGLSGEVLGDEGLKDRLRLWSVWGTNRLIEFGGDKDAARKALAQDLLRSPENRAILIKDLKQELVAAFEKGDLPPDGADQLLQFIDQNRHTLMPQWIGELVGQRAMQGRTELYERLVERIEERVWGESDGDAQGTQGQGTSALRGRVQLRGRLGEGTLAG